MPQSSYDKTVSDSLVKVLCLFWEAERVRHIRIQLFHVLNYLSIEQKVNERAYSTIAAYRCVLYLPLRIALNLDLAGDRVEKLINEFL